MVLVRVCPPAGNSTLSSFHGFDPDAPVRRHNKWRGTEQARKYISELLDKNGIR